MMMNTLCYKTKVPTVYNKGTKYEKSCGTFLLCYLYHKDEEAQALCDRLNSEKPDNYNGIKIDWANIDHLFINKQEEMY